MPKSADSYLSSRWNALQWGTHQNGPMACAGKAKCHFRYCDAAGTSPSVGDPCPHEQELARRLTAEFTDRWGMLAIMPDVDDYDALVAEAVNIRLQQNRAMARLNRSTTLMEDRDSWAKATKEAELADLYLDRLARRQERLDAELQAGLERMNQRAERYRRVMPVVEYIVNARAQAEMPSEPIWDEFADGIEYTR